MSILFWRGLTRLGADVITCLITLVSILVIAWTFYSVFLAMLGLSLSLSTMTSP